MSSTITLDQAVDQTRTGDLWLFQGHSGADRAIRVVTNAPVNHVGMTVVIDDLPPMMWHAELGQHLTDLWTGTKHRGVQLHDLHEAVTRWQEVYGQQGWLRQLFPEVGIRAHDAVLRCVAQMDGTPFPRTSRLAVRWLAGRGAQLVRRRKERALDPEGAFCAEVVARTYEAMGLLERGLPANWYDPGRFWSGDDLPLLEGHFLGAEIRVSG